MNNKKLEEKIMLIVLKVAFFAISYWLSVAHPITVPLPYLLVLFVPAVLRLARSISFNGIGEELRAPFTYVKKDSCGAGADVMPKGVGAQYAIGNLLACPICTAQWSALLLLLAYLTMPAFGTILVLEFGIAGSAEIAHYLAQYLEWSARKSRVMSGAIAPDED